MLRRVCFVFRQIILSAIITHPPASAQSTHLPAQPINLEWSLAERTRIGREEGAEWETFHELRSPAFTRNGELFVLDAGNSRVHAFDSTGAHLRSFGKRGGGPGEFMQAGGLVVTAGDTIAVLDFAARGFHLFTPAGDYIRTHRMPEAYAGVDVPVLAHPRGGVVFAHQSRVSQEASVLWYRFDGTAGPLAKVARPREVQEVRSGGAVMSLASPPPELAPPLAFGLLPDGSLAYTHEAPYQVHLVTASGPTVVGRPDAPRPVTEADREQVRKARRAELERYSGASMVISGGAAPTPRMGGLPPMVIDQMLNNLRFAPVVPAIRGMRVDRAGRIWVLRSTPSAFGASSIDVLRSDGRYVGTIASAELPDAFGPGGLFAFIRIDDLGVQRLSIGRVREK